MSVNNFVLISNPFFDAYSESDYLGKLIFIGLFSLSIISWILIIYKTWATIDARKNSRAFWETFQVQRLNPLSLNVENSTVPLQKSPFLVLYLNLKKYTLEILHKKKQFSGEEAAAPSYLSPTDIDFIQAHLSTTVSTQIQRLEKNLFILSTCVSLSPFLGLLGTVWGILTTFSEMQVAAGTHQSVLSGLSLALATTVLGLLGAIPALIGYNYLKYTIQDFQTDMESFSNEILASVELQYRKVD